MARADVLQEGDAVEGQVVIGAGGARPGVEHELAHVIARKAGHAGGDFVAVEVGRFEDFAHQLANLAPEIALARQHANRLRNFENV